PAGIKRLTFRIVFLDRRIKVSFDHRKARYTLVSGRPLECTHHGESMRLTTGRATVRAIPEIRPGTEPEQPPGRAPARRLPQRARTAAPPELRPRQRAAKAAPRPRSRRLAG